MLFLKDLKLSKPEMLWLKAIYANEGVPDPATFKVNLYGEIPAGFKYENLHRAFVTDNLLNLLGIWVVNSKDTVFENLDKVIKAIRIELRKNPNLKSISAVRISELTEISVEASKEALGHLGYYGTFWSSGTRNTGGEFGQDQIGFSGDEHIDVYLNYKDIQSLLGEAWVKFRLDLRLYPNQGNSLGESKTQLCYSKLCNVVMFGKKKWSFHSNAAKVVRILFETFLKNLPEIHIDEIHAYLPKEIQSDSLSQIFKSHKGESWHELVIAGPSGKGFWQLNPKYLENSVREIDLGLSFENPTQNS